MCVFTSCSVKLPVVDDVIIFLLILSKANVATADAFCRNKFEISMITFCSSKRTIHCPIKRVSPCGRGLPVSSFQLVMSAYRCVSVQTISELQRCLSLWVFIRHWRSENPLFTAQNSPSNVWWPMTSFYLTWNLF